MPDDRAYLEARSDHNAHGSPVPETRDRACRDVLVQGFSAVFECSLFVGHSGPHESFGGTSWGTAADVECGRTS